MLAEAKLNGLPLYQAVKQQLGRDLEAGRWKPGDMLPTEADLARHFDVSIGTVRQAVLALVREGLLTRRPGSGTFVARLDTSRGFGRFFRFTKELSGGVIPRAVHLDTTVLKNGDKEIARKLRIPAHAPLYRIRRTLHVQGEPICIYISYLDRARFPRLEKLNFDDQKLYAAIENAYGVHVLKADEVLHAGVPSPDEARLLGIEPTTPVMIVERTAYGDNGSVVEWRRTVGRSDKFHYRIELP